MCQKTRAILEKTCNRARAPDPSGVPRASGRKWRQAVQARGAPVGSALAGTKDLIRAARRHRKVLGGGMRQSGIIAAGALYALENHVERLADDHANARRLADAIARTPGLRLTPEQVDTNIVIFEVDRRLGTAGQWTERLAAAGALMLSVSARRVRAVTHLDVDRADVERAAKAIASIGG